MRRVLWENVKNILIVTSINSSCADLRRFNNYDCLVAYKFIMGVFFNFSDSTKEGIRQKVMSMEQTMLHRNDQLREQLDHLTVTAGQFTKTTKDKNEIKLKRKQVFPCCSIL